MEKLTHTHTRTNYQDTYLSHRHKSTAGKKSKTFSKISSGSIPSITTDQTEPSGRLCSDAVDTDAASKSHVTTQSLALVVSLCLAVLTTFKELRESR